MKTRTNDDECECSFEDDEDGNEEGNCPARALELSVFSFPFIVELIIELIREEKSLGRALFYILSLVLMEHASLLHSEWN